MATITGASVKAIKDLFNEAAEIVRVPTVVQRQYSWDEEAETFYQDLIRFQADATEADHYFVGSILTVWQSGWGYRLLLDGQQRLATSTILLSAIRDALWALKSQTARTAASTLQRDYIAYALDEHDPKKYFLELTDYDKEFFRSHIQDWDPETGLSPSIKAVVGPSNKLILAVKKRFKALIDADLAKLPGDNEKRTWLLAIRKALVRQIQFVEVTTATEEDANEVFETINDRGLKLSPLDLLRNFLFESAKEHDREQIDDSWKVVWERARDATELEQFIRHYWTSRYGDVRARGLYKELKRVLGADFEKNKNTPKKFADDLEKAGNVYFDLRRQDVSDQSLKAALTEIAELGAQALYPVLLSAYEKHDETAVAPLAEALVSYYVRWSVISRKESTLLESTMFGLALKLHEGQSIGDAIKVLRDSAEQDAAFLEAFKNASVAKATWRRHVLIRLEDAMRRTEGKTELTVKPAKKVNVDHIYPQKPEDQYRLKQPSEHDEYVNRIGNLTLLDRTLNIKARNSTYPVKKDKAYSATEILLTLRTDMDGLWDWTDDRWKPQGIVNRQAELAEFALAAWPL